MDVFGVCGLSAGILSLSLSLPEPGLAEGSQAFPCQNVSAYYSSAMGLSGKELKAELHRIVSGHQSLKYAEVWDALKALDSPELTSTGASHSVVEIYSQKKVPSDSAGQSDGWNREHLWPRSFGLSSGKPQFTDLHNLRPADVNVNSARGNKVFGECSDDAGSSCLVPANREAAPDTATTKTVWLPPKQVQGDIARALMYMSVRYEGEDPDSLDLELSDQPDRANGRMGYLSALLRWHASDPPSDAERRRNERVCSLFQHNRNPFVDHPEFVNRIWPVSEASVGDPQALPQQLPLTAWINELHYSNKGPDVNEFVEVVASSNANLNELFLYLYNGSNGSVYRRLPLSSFVAGQRVAGNWQVLAVRVPSGIQNGLEGLALVAESSSGEAPEVLQFLSYGGTMAATNGPAQGKVSSDIGVKEGGQTEPGASLGLVGSGRVFWWTVMEQESFGSINLGQMLL